MKLTNVKLAQPNSSLDIYQSDTSEDFPAIVIVPGGGYKQFMLRDTERLALTFVTHAFQVFVVRYPVAEHKSYQDAKVAVSQAFDYIVDHANDLHVDVNRLGVLGVSAGGQLAAAYSCQPNNHARFVGLGYPVIQPLIDDKMGVTTENVAKLVTPQTAPTFIWGTINDKLAPFVDHIDVYAKALDQAGVPFELHEFSTGHHGDALANHYTGVVNSGHEDTHMGQWFPLFLEWLKTLK